FLTNLTTSDVIGPSQMSLTHLADFAEKFTFPGYQNSDYYGPIGVLQDGNYESILAHSGVKNAQNQPLPADYKLPFFFLTGDINHDRTIDTVDFGVLTGNFAQSPRVFSAGDLNYDGTVDTEDFAILSSKFAAYLPPPPTAANALTATPLTTAN